MAIITGSMHVDGGEEFDLNAAVAAYFEQHARNEKSIADQKAVHKEERETLKDEIDAGHRNPFTVALGEFNTREFAEILRQEIERRLASAE